MRAGTAARRRECGHRARVRRTEAQVGTQEVATVDFEVVEFNVIADCSVRTRRIRIACIPRRRCQALQRSCALVSRDPQLIEGQPDN